MRNVVNSYVERFRHAKQARRRVVSIIVALALVVSCGVYWGLRTDGVAMANETFCGQEEHMHGEECYEQVLVCGLEESEEAAGHAHDASCYDEDSNLICGLEETEAVAGHTHTDDCYESVLVCETPEHVHDITCLIDETADVETAADWEDTLPEELSGIWADDVVAIAESQIGYAESEANFQLDEDGETRQGYTRYGAWYGNEYGDWDAMFASFCLYYAGVPEDEFSEADGVYAWIVDLDKTGLYVGAADYEPVPGDIIFFDEDGDGQGDRAGIVEYLDDAKGTMDIIEGNSSDAVEENTYGADDETILGYGILPEQPEEAMAEEYYETPALAEQTVNATIYSDASLISTLSAPESITLSGLMPENASVTAYPVDVTIGDMGILAAYDITIYDENGHEYEPEDGQIHVTMTNQAIREALSEDAEPVVYHINNATDELETVGVAAAADGAVEFDAESFSIYIVGDNDGYTDTKTGETVTVYTVEFYQYEFDATNETAKGPTWTSTQYVAETDTLNEPAVPEYEHHVFDGWFTEMQISAENEPGNKFDFTKTLKENLDAWGSGYTLGEHHTVDLYTDYDPVYYVEFKTEESPTFGGGDDYMSYVFHTDTYHENNAILDTTDVGILYWQQYLQLEGETVEQATTYAVVDWYYYDETDEKADNDGKVLISNKADANGNYHVTDDMVLYPVVEGAIWLFFDMNIEDASEIYIEPSPIYVLENTSVGDSLPDAERPGYTFDGWWTEGTGGTQITSTTTFDNLLTYVQNGEITVYAHWTPTTVGYTVNIWRQKATDGQEGLDQKVVKSGEKYEDYIKYYDYAESITISADDERALTTGSANLTYQDFGSYTTSSGSGPFAQTETVYYWNDWTGYGWSSSSDGTGDYVGFEYNETRTLNDLATIEVEPDGSTIINIFYDRVTVTYHFGTSTNADSRGTLIGLYDTNTKVADDVTPGGTLNGWPEPGDRTQWRFVTDRSYAGYTYTGMSFLAKFALTENYSYRSNVVYFSSNSTSYSSTLYYYLEVTNPDKQVTDTSQTTTINGTTYVLDYTLTFAWDFTGSGTPSVSFNITDKYIGYYAVGYRKSSSGTYNKLTEDNNPVSLNNNGSLYIFNDALEYNIDLYSNHNGEQLVGSYTFKYGEDLTSTIFPIELDAEKYGPAYYYQFTGTWWEDPTFTAEFIKPEIMPANNLVAYADWEPKDITVTFVSAVDSNLYDLLVNAYGAYNENTNPDGVKINNDGSYSIIIKAGETVDITLAALNAVDTSSGGNEGGEESSTADSDRYTFVSWMNESSIFNVTGHLYDDTTLVASWNDNQKEHHSVKYYLNLGGNEEWDDPEEYAVQAGSYAKLYLVEDIFKEYLSEHEGQAEKFICWNTKSDGTGTDYYPDDLYNFADTHEDVTLYAKWATELESVLHVHYNYPDGYDLTRDDEYPDVDITVENLGTVDLSDTETISLHENFEIVVNGVTYRFVGWSTDENKTSTLEDVEIPADATVAVDGTDTNEERINNLYAVWLAELQFTIEKTDTDGNSLGGAVFTLTYDVTEGEGDGATTTTYYYSETTTTSDGGGEVVTGSWSTTYATITLGEIKFTDHDGDLDGSETFTLTEVKAPDGYDALANAITFTLNVEDSTVRIETNVTGKGGSELASAYNTTLTVQNEKVYSVDIFKYDSVTKEPLENVSFVLCRYDEENYIPYYALFTYDENSGVYTVVSWYDYMQGDTNCIVYSDGEGYIHIDGLVPGTYYLSEYMGLDGYLTPTGDFEFIINENGSITSDYLQGSNAEPGDGEETEDERQLDIPNVQQSLNVLKTDEDGLPLEGAEFVMGRSWQEASFAKVMSVPVSGTDWYYEYLTFTGDDGGYVYNPNGGVDMRESATTLTTGEDGKFNVTGLYTEGLYFLIETKAPDGYELMENPIVFYIDYDGTIHLISPVGDDENANRVEVNDTDSTITVMDKTSVFDVQIFKYTEIGSEDSVQELSHRTKTYAVSQNALAGAKFTLSKTNENGDTLYAVADFTLNPYGYYYYTVTEWTKNANEATLFTSDIDGYIDIVNVEAGTYTLTEIEAPDGYYLLTESIVFTVGSDGSLTVVSGPAETDGYTGDDGNTYSWITIANTEITGAFDPEKTNSDGTTLEGAEFILGYFWKNNDTEQRVLAMTPDEEYYYYYGILNYDEVTGTYVFDWYDSSETRDGATVMATGENGRLSISNLPVSSVYEAGFFLIETKAPDGYALLEDPIVFLVNDDGMVSIAVDGSGKTVGSDAAKVGKDSDGTTVMTIVDEPGRELPKTGGPGTRKLTLFGLLLAGTAAGLLYRNRKRGVIR